MSYLKSIDSVNEDEAKNLGEIVFLSSTAFRNGINLLPMVVISENFYWDYLSENHLKEYILDMVSNLKVVKDKGFSEVSKDIQNAIRSNPLSSRFTEEIKSGYDTLAVDDKRFKIISFLLSKRNVPCILGVSFNKKGFSHQSLDAVPRYINVMGIDKISDLIVNIFASFFSKNMLEEKIRVGRPLLEPLGPLYLQKFVYFEKSGYAFFPNDLNHFVAESVPGMIFSLRNNEVSPDRIEYNLASSEVVNVKLGFKNEQYVFDKKTDVIQKVENSHPEDLSLSESEIFMVAKNMRKIADLFGRDAKIEFGISNGNFYVTEIRIDNVQKSLDSSAKINEIDDEKEVVFKMDSLDEDGNAQGASAGNQNDKSEKMNVFEISDDSKSSSVENNSVSNDVSDNSNVSETKNETPADSAVTQDVSVNKEEDNVFSAVSETSDDSSLNKSVSSRDDDTHNEIDSERVKKEEPLSFDILKLEKTMDAVILKFVKINPALKDSLELFKEEVIHRLNL